jgi:hypothetical protein
MAADAPAPRQAAAGSRPISTSAQLSRICARHRACSMAGQGGNAMNSDIRKAMLAGPAPLLDQFLAMTDDPDDPATWILDGVEDRLGWVEATALATAREALGLDAIVNQLILARSPDLVADLMQLGSDTAELAGGLEMSSRLVVRETASGALVADHTITRLRADAGRRGHGGRGRDAAAAGAGGGPSRKRGSSSSIATCSRSSRAPSCATAWRRWRCPGWRRTPAR